MNKEMINKVFDWLEKEVNGKGYYELILEDRDQITAYWKDTYDRFAHFYIQPIIEILENNEGKIMEENKGIEKLKIKDSKIVGNWENGSHYNYTLSAPQTVLANKINELIDAVQND